MSEPKDLSSLGQYIREISDKPLLTSEEEYELAVRNQAGDAAAKAKLIESNLRLVASVAREYNFDFLIGLEDLIGYGNLGLIKAVEKFNPEKRYRFSTYAKYWIRHYITRAIDDKARLIRIPVYAIARKRKIEGVRGELAQELKREPYDEEIAERMGISIEKIREIYKKSQEPISLEESIKDCRDDICYWDVMEDETCENPEEAAIDKISLEKLIGYIEKADRIKPRDMKIFLLRTGIVDGVVWPLRKCAKEFNINHQRVAVIEKTVRRKLSESKVIKKYAKTNPEVTYEFLQALEKRKQKEEFLALLLFELDKSQQLHQIVALKMGYIDGNKHSSEEISTRIGVPSEFVDTLFAKALKKISLSHNRDKLIAYDANLGTLINYYEQKIEGNKQKS